MGYIADVFKVTLEDKNTSEVVASTTMTEANIDFSLDENEIRGGDGNQLLGILHSNRDVSISLTDVGFNYSWIAKQMGSDVVTGAGIAYATPKYFDVVDGGAGEPIITLDNAPNATDDGLFIENADGKEITGYTVSGSDVDFSAASPTVAIGDRIRVLTYRYDTDANTETIEFDVTKYPVGVKVNLTTMEIDGGEQPLNTIQYQFDYAVPNGSFTIDTSSERNASNQEMGLRVIKPDDSNVIGRSLRIPFGS